MASSRANGAIFVPAATGVNACAADVIRAAGRQVEVTPGRLPGRVGVVGGPAGDAVRPVPSGCTTLEVAVLGGRGNREDDPLPVGRPGRSRAVEPGLRCSRAAARCRRRSSPRSTSSFGPPLLSAMRRPSGDQGDVLPGEPIADRTRRAAAIGTGDRSPRTSAPPDEPRQRAVPVGRHVASQSLASPRRPPLPLPSDAATYRLLLFPSGLSAECDRFPVGRPGHRAVDLPAGPPASRRGATAVPATMSRCRSHDRTSSREGDVRRPSGDQVGRRKPRPSGAAPVPSRSITESRLPGSGENAISRPSGDQTAYNTVAGRRPAVGPSVRVRRRSGSAPWRM